MEYVNYQFEDNFKTKGTSGRRDSNFEWAKNYGYLR